MTEKGKYLKDEIMNSADALFEDFEYKKKVLSLNKMEADLTSDELENYDNMIVDAFETSEKGEVGQYVGQINKIFEEYPDLEDISKLKLEVLVYELSGDEDRVDILNDYKRLLFPVTETSN